MAQVWMCALCPATSDSTPGSFVAHLSGHAELADTERWPDGGLVVHAPAITPKRITDFGPDMS